MSQYNFGDLSSPTSGTALINTHLEPWRTALHSMHSGSSRPSYAIAGLMWLDTTSTPWVVKMFDGTDDISIGTVNATTNAFAPSGVGTAAFKNTGTSGDALGLLNTANTYAEAQSMLKGVINGLAKSGSASVTSNATLTDISGMSVDVVAGGLYAVTFNGSGSTAGAGGFRVGFGGTATFTTSRAWGVLDSSGVMAGGYDTNASGTIINNGAATNFRFAIDGTFTVNAAGTFKAQFAQNTSNATATILNSASMILTRIS